MRADLTRTQRNVVVERYRRGHAILQAIKLLSDAQLGKAHGISASSVRRIAARGFKYAKCSQACHRALQEGGKLAKYSTETKGAR